MGRAARGASSPDGDTDHQAQAVSLRSISDFSQFTAGAPQRPVAIGSPEEAANSMAQAAALVAVLVVVPAVAQNWAGLLEEDI